MAGFDGDRTNSVRVIGNLELMASLQSLPQAVGSKYIKGAVAAGMKPVFAQLTANTPIGPTGNLKNSVGQVVRVYKTGVIYGVVGYRRAVSKSDSGNKAYHSHLVEFGTRDRVPTKSPFLSSYSISGWTPPGWSGRWPFVAKRVRGARALHPLGTAFSQTRSQALAIVLAEMQSGLQKGIAEVARKGL